MGEGAAGMRRGVFVAWLGAIMGTVLLQSAAHLEVVLGTGNVGSIVDLDRSNGLPDVVSTASLAASAAAAMLLASLETGRRRAVAAALERLTDLDPHRFSQAWQCARRVTEGRIVGLASSSVDGTPALLVYTHSGGRDQVTVVTGCNGAQPSAGPSAVLSR